MTFTEFREKYIALQKECDYKQMELRKQYAIEHNPAKDSAVASILSNYKSRVLP